MSQGNIRDVRLDNLNLLRVPKHDSSLALVAYRTKVQGSQRPKKTVFVLAVENLVKFIDKPNRKGFMK